MSAYGQFDGRVAVGPVCWAWFDLFWVHSGRVNLRVMGESPVTLQRGQGMLIYPHTPFEGEAESRVVRASVQHFELTAGVAAARLPAPLRRLRGKSRGCEQHTPGDIEWFEEMLDHAVQLSLLPVSPLVDDLRAAQLVLLLGHLELHHLPAAPAGPPQSELGQLLEQIRLHPQRPWSLAEMAGSLNLSVSHFRAMFRQRVGVSPGRYRQQMRLREAARLLRDTDEPIKSIAGKLSFSDLPHFHRQFKAEHGQTPRRYRAQRSPRA
ncbi:MAG: helix-turn-helix transcriptional regulator [Phycisphaeraceae bacterium]|nr:helix-turn-helix transcriptional regulator [Phycisphaeraceae bacterium]